MKSRTLLAIVVGGSISLMPLLMGCRANAVERPLVPVRVAVVELSSGGSGSRYSATIIPGHRLSCLSKSTTSMRCNRCAVWTVEA
jgi:hypothetical protein